MDAPIGILLAGRLAVARAVAKQLPYQQLVDVGDPARTVNQVVAAGART